MQSFTHLLLPNGDGQGLCLVSDVEVTVGERDTQSDRRRDRKSHRECSVPVCMVILGHMSNNHTALNGKAAQEEGEPQFSSWERLFSLTIR